MYANADSCFVHVQEARNWSLAEATCTRTLKGHLTHIFSPNDNYILEQIMRKENINQAWIGLYGTAQDGFNWIHSNASAGFQFWSRLQMNFEGQVCGFIDSGYQYFWRRTKCEVSLPFICRIPMLVKPESSSGLVWSEWSDATECDATCGGGKRIRMRECNDRPYRCSNRTEDSIEVVKCATEPCPSKLWSEWAQWSSCSSTCSFGKEMRKRVAVCSHGADCSLPEEEDEERMCYTPCPTLRDWATWHQGVSTCRFNQQWLKVDELNVEKDVVGRPQLTCRTDSAVNEDDDWSEWRRCKDGLYYRQADAGCADGGPHFREKRQAVEECGGEGASCMEMHWALGNDTSPPDARPTTTVLPQITIIPTTTETVTTQAPVTCPSVTSAEPLPDCDPLSLEWSPWSDCSVSCNTGSRFRTKNLTDFTSCHIHMTEERVCNTVKCPEWTQWDQWSRCNVNCTHRVAQQIRRRICDVFDESGDSYQLSHCPDADCNGTACSLQRRTCDLGNDTQYCIGTTRAPPPMFRDLSVEAKVVAVVQLAVNTLGSIFVAAVCAFELIAFAIARCFTPQRQLQMGQEMMQLLAHLALLYMVRMKETGLVCTFLAGLLNYTFLAYFLYLSLGLPLLFTGGMLYFLDYGDGEHGLVLEPKTQQSEIGKALLCWVDLAEEGRLPAKIYFVTFCTLLAIELVSTESTAIFASLYPIPQPNTDWNRMGDAEFAYTGMYPMIFLSFVSWASTLIAFTLSVGSPKSGGSTIFFGSLSLGLNIAFGSTLFFYHSFANARVRRVIQLVRDKLRSIGRILKSGGQGNAGAVSPDTEEGELDEEGSYSSRPDSAYSGDSAYSEYTLPEPTKSAQPRYQNSMRGLPNSEKAVRTSKLLWQQSRRQLADEKY